MFNGGGEIEQITMPVQISTAQLRHTANVRIIEQPASKALRFRYECEGRSAGSIPGASSTPENKTFPAIRVEGYQGRAVVVVSCVTKDAPHRPHPHNLVGREGCKKGVCTLEIPPETMTVTFSNLGIQCVKKRDIENALRVREEIRVDPFRTGFGHRNQPTSIDLNSVRLCFQVFLEGDRRGKFTVPLTPVVSEPIYDKKAMCDLVIVKLSDCVSYVDGGRKDIILLCEKVAKEDIQVRFFEEIGGNVVWEGLGDFQPSQVHKQTAIWFRTPRYKTLDVTEPVKVFIQLRRPSDGATSEALPFELLPLDSGRPPYWSFRRNLSKKGNYNLFSTLLANDAKLLTKRQLDLLQTKNDVSNYPETNNETNTIKESSDIIEQVAELDQIYSDTKAKILNENVKSLDEVNISHSNSFDDSHTYTSIQLAFKNPLAIDLNRNYEDVLINPQSPLIDLNPKPAVQSKRENELEKLPPLPPKRAKKIETYIGEPLENVSPNKQTSLTSLPIQPPPRSNSFSLSRPKSELMQQKKNLRPTSCSTLPNPKKRGFFSKLFGRKSKIGGSSESNLACLSNSSKSLQIGNNSTLNIRGDNSTLNISSSVGNLSQHSTNSVRIPLKDDSPTTSVKNLNAPEDTITFDPTGEELAMNLDLTEAEHYALYTAMAPHATQSEFDEMSYYYAPVEGGKILTNAEVLARLSSKT